MLSKERLPWIDFLRGLAIIAVVLDHLYGYAHAYSSELILQHTIFSVTLFIILSGLTTYISFERQKNVTFSYWFNKICKLIIPYVLASGVYHFANLGLYTQESFWYRLFHFSAADHFYFLQFFLGLVLVAPALFWLVKRCEKSKHFWLLIGLSTLALFGISILASRFPVISGKVAGQYLFGGTYLFAFFLGIVGIPVTRRMNPSALKNGFYLAGITGLLVSEVYSLGYAWANPPNGYTFIYALAVFCIIYAVSRTVNFHKHGLTSLICLFGKRSLHIYFYHLIVILILYRSGLNSSGLHLMVVFAIYFSGALLIPVGLYTMIKVSVSIPWGDRVCSFFTTLFGNKNSGMQGVPSGRMPGVIKKYAS